MSKKTPFPTRFSPRRLGWLLLSQGTNGSEAVRDAADAKVREVSDNDRFESAVKGYFAPFPRRILANRGLVGWKPVAGLSS
jgi:hypothetical protein